MGETALFVISCVLCRQGWAFDYSSPDAIPDRLYTEGWRLAYTLSPVAGFEIIPAWICQQCCLRLLDNGSQRV